MDTVKMKPKKVIHKYKNNNNIEQYNTYIFIGKHVPVEVYKVLQIIKQLSLYDSLIEITKEEFKIVQKYYNNYKWFEYFFNNEHLKEQFNQINGDKNKYNKLFNKYGNKMMDLIKIKQYGGFDEENINDEEMSDDEITVIDTVENLDDEKFQEEIDIDNMISSYKKNNNNINTNVIKNITSITKEIKEVVDDKNINHKMVQFDITYENLNTTIELKDNYIKIYIRTYFLYDTDTVQNLKKKISLSIPLQNIFENIAIIPEYQYLWDKNGMIEYLWNSGNDIILINKIPDDLHTYAALENNYSNIQSKLNYRMKKIDTSAYLLNNFSNEIFLLDIFNEFKSYRNYTDKELYNIYSIYIKLYFPELSYDRLIQILDYINEESNMEYKYNVTNINTIRNDIILEEEIVDVVENCKKCKAVYDKYFGENYIVQLIIYTDESFNSNIDMYKIFDSFLVDNKYPYVQYKTPSGNIYKYYDEKNYIKENIEILQKWFNDILTGISFKIKTNDDSNHIIVNINEKGKIEYRMSWKYEKKTTIEDIKTTYEYINELVKKINKNGGEKLIKQPKEEQYKYAFINSVLKFTLPNKHYINHNDLSNLCRYFYNYVALVIEPNKRVSLDNNNKMSKYGTYLRYKKIDNYNSIQKIHTRIIYLSKNFNITINEILDIVSKQFTITKEKAYEEYENIKKNYPKLLTIKNKVLKPATSIPRIKTTGVSIEIQGKDPSDYSIRIIGAREHEMLKEIVDFIKIVIYIYVEIYINKKSKFKNLNERLHSLMSIAKKRNMVEVFVEYSNLANETSVRKIVEMDKLRIGFKPNRGKNYWTRLCQNSGKHTRKRPMIHDMNSIDNLIKKGYILNKSTGIYEKKVKIDDKNVYVKALKLPVMDDTSNEKYNYYTCDKENNGDYIYPGFLAKGNNPNNLCIPCCYKKDQSMSINKIKQKYYYDCLANNNKGDREIINYPTDKIYVANESDRAQKDKYNYLTELMDILFNKLNNNSFIIKKHFLEQTEGYYLKYTTHDNTYPFLIAISKCLNISIEDIKNKCIDFLQKDKTDKYYTYLNNGVIRKIHGDKKNYIDYIKKSNYIDYNIIGELICIPGVFLKEGIIIFTFVKNKVTIKNQLDKDTIITDYGIECINVENNNHFLENRNYIFLIKEQVGYSIIKYLIKQPKQELEEYTYYLYNKFKPMITNIYNYYDYNCNNNYLENIFMDVNISAKQIISKCNDVGINILNQYIDYNNYKCIFLEIEYDKKTIIIPVKHSGVSYQYTIKNINSIQLKDDLYKIIDKIKEIEKKLNIGYIPVGVSYRSKENNKIKPHSIIFKNALSVPLVDSFISIDEIHSLGLYITAYNEDDKINKAIYENIELYDDRIHNVKSIQYKIESYNIFRLEISTYLNDNTKLKNKIIDIVRSVEMSNKNKFDSLTKIFYSIVNIKSSNDIKPLDIVYDKTLHDLKEYNTSNILKTCNNKQKSYCDNIPYCSWKNNKCNYNIYKNYIHEFVHNIIHECIMDTVQFQEIINENNYYVTNIIDKKYFTTRDNQKILYSNKFNSSQEEILNIRNSKKLHRNSNNNNYIEIITHDNFYIQEVDSFMSLLRAYVNCYYWYYKSFYLIENRNLGYNNDLQLQLVYIIRSNIYDFLLFIKEVHNKSSKHNDVLKELEEIYGIEKPFDLHINNLVNDFVNYKVNLLILSYIIPIPILIYNDDMKITNIYFQGEIKVNNNTIKKYDKYSDYINIQFDISNGNKTFDKVKSLYYRND